MVLPDQDARRESDQKEGGIRVDVRSGALQIDIDRVDGVVPPGPQPDHRCDRHAHEHADVEAGESLDLGVDHAGGEGQERDGDEIQRRHLVADPAVAESPFHRRADVGIPEQPAVDDGNDRRGHQDDEQPGIGNLDWLAAVASQRKADQKEEGRRQGTESKPGGPDGDQGKGQHRQDEQGDDDRLERDWPSEPAGRRGRNPGRGAGSHRHDPFSHEPALHRDKAPRSRRPWLQPDSSRSRSGEPAPAATA